MEEHVVSGYWKDYTTGNRYILVKNDKAVMISNILAVLVTLSLPRLLVFLKLIILHITKRFGKYTISAEAIQFYDIVRHAQSTEAMAASVLEEYVLNDEIRSRRTISRTPLLGLRAATIRCRNNFQRHPKRTSFFLSASLLLFSIFIGYQVIAICAGQIIGPSVARSAFPLAGAWFVDPIFDYEQITNPYMFSDVTEFYTDMSNKALAYVDTCYMSEEFPEECSFFHTAQLPYSEDFNATCPFQEHICLEGPDSAYELTTGWLDSQVLGINVKQGCKFRMRKACAPLAVSEDYVRSFPLDDEYRYVQYFYGDGYGIGKQGNMTFGERVRNPNRTLSDPPRYSIQEIRNDMFDFPDVVSTRQWIPELNVPGARTSLYFVRAEQVRFTQPSFDPIFPATIPDEDALEGDYDPLYRTPLQRSTILACADSIEIQHPVTGAVWLPRTQNISQLALSEWQHPDIAASLHMINASYLQSEYFDFKYTGLSEYFDAPRRIRRSYSLPLDPQQWQLEVRKMFNIRLAQLQFHVLGIAQGIGHGLPRAKNVLSDYNIEPDGKILFQSLRWTNLKFDVFIGFLGLCAGLWITTVQVGDKLVLAWFLKSVVFSFLREKVVPFFVTGWAFVTEFDEVILIGQFLRGLFC